MAGLLDQLKTKVKKSLDDFSSGFQRNLNTGMANLQAMGSNLSAAAGQVMRTSANASEKLYNTLYNSPLGLPTKAIQSYAQGRITTPIVEGGQNLRSNSLFGKAMGAMAPAQVAFNLTPLGIGVNAAETGIASMLQTARNTTKDQTAFGGIKNLASTFNENLAKPYAGIGSTGLGIQGIPGMAVDIASNPMTAPSLVRGIANKGRIILNNFTMSKPSMDELIVAEEMIRNPQNYLGKIKTGAQTEKEALKAIQAKGNEIVERLSGKYLPTKQLTTLKTAEQKIKALTDLHYQNRLTNMPEMGIVDKNAKPQSTVGNINKKYYIYKWDNRGGKYDFVEVKGKPVKIGNTNIDAFIHRNTYDTGWSVSEARSGLALSDSGSKTQKQAIEEATNRVNQYINSGNKIEDLIETAVQRNGLSPRFSNVSQAPLNDIKPTIKIKPKSVVGKKPFNVEILTGKTAKPGQLPIEQPLPGTGQSVRVQNKGSSRQGSYTNSISTTVKDRGFITSVNASPNNVSKAVKGMVAGEYQPKPNKQLMGEAKVLLENLPEGSKINFNGVTNLDQKIAATIQEAINLDKKGNHEAAANLYNNLARHGTELGRGVQAFSLLDKMSPAAISKTVAARIQQYNRTTNHKIPELTGDQQKLISQAVKKIDSFAVGSRERNIATNELQNLINSFIPTPLVDKALAVWKAGLLTSLRTHERNLVGNAIMGASEVAKDVIASPVDRLMRLKTGQRTLTFTPKTGTGYKKGAQAAVDMVRYGFDPEETITKFDFHQINWGKNPVEQALKKYTDAVFRTLGAEDKIPWNAAFARSLYDQAGAAAVNAGRAGDKAFIENLVKNPTEAMLTAATKDANYATFKDKNKLSSLAGTIKRWANERWFTKLPVEIVAPFTGVPSSVAGKTIDYSPIGLVKGAIDVGRVMLSKTPLPELQRQAAQEVGRGVMGTGLFGLGAYLMSKGLMTGQPKDAAEARQWQLENKPANSILINGKWRSINSVGPQTLILLAGAKYNESKNNPEEGIGGYAAGLGRDQLSQTFLQGVQQPLSALTDPNRYGNSYLGKQASSIIPNIVKDASRAFDPYVRENNTVGDYFTNSLPFIRNQNIPKRDALGNIIPQEPTGAAAFVDLFNSKTPISNPVVNELARLNNAGANATPGNLTKNQTIGGVKTTLTPAQLNVLEAELGPRVQQALAQLFSTPEYKNLSDQDKGKAIDDVVATIRKQVRDNLTVDKLASTPSNSPKVTQAAAISNDNQIMVVNPETGSVKTIPLNWNPPELKLTGYKELDKKLKSEYTSALNSRIRDIVTLNKNGKLTNEEAAAQIAAINALKSTASGGGKKISLGTPVKLTPIKVATPSYRLPVISFSNSALQPIKFTPQRTLPKLKLKLKQLPAVKLA